MAVLSDPVEGKSPNPLILFNSVYDYPHVVTEGEEQLRVDLTPGRYTAEAAYLEIPDTAYLIRVRLTPATEPTSRPMNQHPFRQLEYPTLPEAVFNEDVVRHYQAFLDRCRQARPADEYREVTRLEWLGFEEHFDQLKVELGGCARPYGTACQHEHDLPEMSPDQHQPEDAAPARRDRRRPPGPQERTAHEGWLGEIEGIDLALAFLRQKRDQARRLARIAPTGLGMPGVLSTGRAP